VEVLRVALEGGCRALGTTALLHLYIVSSVVVDWRGLLKRWSDREGEWVSTLKTRSSATGNPQKSTAEPGTNRRAGQVDGEPPTTTTEPLTDHLERRDPTGRSHGTNTSTTHLTLPHPLPAHTPVNGGPGG
jgi:hypothetical protein